MAHVQGPRRHSPLRILPALVSLATLVALCVPFPFLVSPLPGDLPFVRTHARWDQASKRERRKVKGARTSSSSAARRTALAGKRGKTAQPSPGCTLMAHSGEQVSDCRTRLPTWLTILCMHLWIHCLSPSLFGSMRYSEAPTRRKAMATGPTKLRGSLRVTVPGHSGLSGLN